MRSLLRRVTSLLIPLHRPLLLRGAGTERGKRPEKTRADADPRRREREGRPGKTAAAALGTTQVGAAAGVALGRRLRAAR